MQVKFLHPKFIPTWLLLLLMWLASKLNIRLQLFLGIIFGNVLRVVARKRYRIAQQNLKLCFPNKTKTQNLAKQHFIELGISTFEIANCFFASVKKLNSCHIVKNSEVVSSALKQKQNIVFLIGHFTTMLIAGRILALHFSFADIYRPQNNALFDFIMTKRFGSFGLKMVSAKEPKKMLQALKSGLPIWYAHDQDLGTKGSVFAKFFGVDTATISATAKFAKAKNTVVIPITYWRDASGYVLEFAKPLENYPTGDKIADANLTNQILEQQVLRNLSQYGWIHKRFKTRPDGEASFYN